MIWIEDGFGDCDIADACMDCEFSYVEDIWYEWQCKRKRCKYNKAERLAIIERETRERNDE